MTQAPPAGVPTDGARARLVQNAARLAKGPGDTVRIERVTVPLKVEDPLRWLAAQPSGNRFYWQGRDDGRVLATAGVADLIEGYDALDRLEDRLARAPEGARYVGGIRFDGERATDQPWRPFGPACFVLPRFELESIDGETHLSLNLLLPGDRGFSPELLLKQVSAVSEIGFGSIPLPVDRSDSPTTEAWRALVEMALGAISEKSLSKVVLARRTTFRFDEPIDPFSLLHELRAEEAGCFHFLIEPAPGRAFLGASPELLFRWSHGRIEAEAVAGTRRRDPSPSRDDAIRRDLLSSDKDRREHGFVVDHVRNVFEACCGEVEAGEAAAMQLVSKWHIRTPIASNSCSTRPLDVLRRLHPTPAVCGTPVEEAAALIRATEPFDRGWYAGPIGWIGGEEAEFAVAIRSGLVTNEDDGPRLDVYAGAGIVRGSDPVAESSEIEHKIGAFTRALGLAR